jgi:two-component system, cell cycle sensor histidine kinase and response regulator CckA
MEYTQMTKEELLNELREKEQRLSQVEASERRYRGTLEAIGDVISVQDTSFIVLYQNQANKDFLGADAVGKYCYAAYENKDRVCEGCPVARVFDDGKIHTAERSGITDKGPVLVEVTASPLRDSTGKIVGAIEVARNITERKRTVDQLQAAEAKFRSIVEQSLVGIYIFQDNRFPYVNPKAAEIFGYNPDEFISEVSLNDIICEEYLELVDDNIRRRIENEVKILHFKFKGKRKDLTILDLEVQGTRTEFNGKPAIIGTILDITERKKMETERSRMQNLESLGVFASGVAHEYNNLLTAIIGNLSLAKMYAKPGYEVYDVLAEAEKASVRAKDLTLQLLIFADGSRTAKKIIDLKERLKEWVGSALNDSQIIPKFNMQEALWPVEADEPQIHQALDNIVTNARQSMPEGGLIRVKAKNVDIDAPTESPLDKGKYVLISIEDQGGGIPDKYLLKIFDPFYTTKQKNTGLGLSSSYSIIKNHGGHISVDSQLGIGTTFHIYLPAFLGHISASKEVLKTYPFGRGKILVMDDEEIVRLVVGKLLSQCGYEAELASDGEEMLKMYKAAREIGQPFKAVIMDLGIEGGMGGQEAIKYLLDIDPHAKAIVSSGYSHAPVMSHFNEFGFIGFLAKPYRLEELGKVLHEVLTEKEE